MALLDDAKAIRVGATAAKAVYAGSTLVWPKTPGTPARPTVTQPTHTTCTLSWAAVPDATAYEVRHQLNVAAGNIMTTVTEPRTDVWGMGHNSHYDFEVRTKRVIGSNTLYSPWGPKVRYNTGTPEVRKQGSGAKDLRPSNTGTWRPNDGWSWNGTRVAQGYNSSSSANGHGVVSYDTAGFRNWFHATYGADVWNNTSVNFYRVAIYRNNTSGSSAARTIGWHLTPSVAHSGGQPQIAGGVANGTLGHGQAGWFNAGAGFMHWAKHILWNEIAGGPTSPLQSWLFYHGGTHDYMIFLGYNEAGNAFDLYVEFSWNFVTQSYVAPTWQNV